MMTKKDFKAIADILKNEVMRNTEKYNLSKENALIDMYDLISDFCIMFKEENLRFDEDKFREVIRNG